MGQLIDRCYAAAAGDEGYVREVVGLPFVAGEGGEDKELVAWFEGVEIAASFAVGVFLDHEFYIAGFIYPSQ